LFAVQVREEIKALSKGWGRLGRWKLFVEIAMLCWGRRLRRTGVLRAAGR